jgi:hypothetical protein
MFLRSVRGDTMGSILVSYSICDTVEFMACFRIWTLSGKGIGPRHSFHWRDGLKKYQDLFPEFELLWGGVRSSAAVLLAVRAYFQNLNFLWGWIRSSSAVLLAVGSIFRVYFQNLNFLWGWIRSSSAVLLAVGSISECISRIWTFCGDVFDSRQLVSTGCASLFPEFELFWGMGSIHVSCSIGCGVHFSSLFPEFELFVGMGSILVSLVLLAVRVYFQNLNFLWGWVRSSSAVPLAIWSNSRLSLRREDLG